MARDPDVISLLVGAESSLIRHLALTLTGLRRSLISPSKSERLQDRPRDHSNNFAVDSACSIG